MSRRPSQGFGPALCAAAILAAGAGWGQSGFGSGATDAITWRTCQTDYNPGHVAIDALTGALRFRVESAKLGGDACNPQADCAAGALLSHSLAPPDFEPDDQPGVFEDLGPDVLGAAEGAPQRGELGVLNLEPPAASPFCTADLIERIAKEKREQCDAPHEGRCIQRVELRPRELLPAEVAQSYRFRLTPPAASQYARHNVRWSLVQWKNDVSQTYMKDHKASGAEGDFAQSPFVALRFNRGVLHVTVQDEHCRCVVAAAPAADGSVHRLWDQSGPDAGKLKKCLSTYPAAISGAPCESGLRVVAGDGLLVAPAHPPQSTAYRFEFRHARPVDGFIRVFEGDRLVVKARGPLGYAPAASPGTTKFKLGHYRDYFVGDPGAETPLIVEGVSYWRR